MEPPRKSDKVASLVYRLLLHSMPLETGIRSRLWQKAWTKSCRIFGHRTVETTIHGYNVLVNYGYMYPIYARRFPAYNNPLIELVYQAYQMKKSPITFADIGAAAGDTILLIESNCSGMVGGFYCVDGDREFFSYLTANLARFQHGKLYFALLAGEAGTARELVRIHSGTASAQGDNLVPTVTLDHLLLEPDNAPVDVLKIDVDGFDGEVLRGSTGILETQKPAVIFEWHPQLCRDTGNSWTTHFQVLQEYDYPTFVWFDKFGNFSHFSYVYDKESIDTLAELCLRDRLHHDWHYDVIALHRESPISPLLLAETGFARMRRSSF